MFNESTLLLRKTPKTAGSALSQMRNFLLVSSSVVLLLLATSARAKDFIPKVGPDLKSITVNCGDVTLLLRQNTQWTPGRFDFRGSPMTTERSAYGTVFMFPEIGFIGTGHFENEPEDLQSVSFSLNEKSVKTPTSQLTGNTFAFYRTSKIRDFALVNIIEIRDERIIETTTISTEKAVPLSLVYNFMHAWVPTVSDYLAGFDDSDKEELSEPLPVSEEANRKFHINKAVDWVAVFEPESNRFAVSRLLQSPQEAAAKSKIWNVNRAYRKFYHTSFQNKTVPAGFKGTWKMVTAFGEATPETWKSKARKLATDLRKESKAP